MKTPRQIAVTQAPAYRGLTGLTLVHDRCWAIDPVVAESLWRQLESISIEAHNGTVASPMSARPEYDRQAGGIAVISMSGPMTKGGSYWDAGCSTVAVRKQIRAAATDDECKGILLRIDSPGGTVSGTEDLARDVMIAASKKPVYAFCEDNCCSAAYWVASQATRIYANPTAVVGSIGTYAVVTDYSEMASMAGLKVHVLSTGEHKGAGSPGAEITEPQLAEFQRLVDDLNRHFLSSIGRGRSMGQKRVKEIADGRVWLARTADGSEDALSLGLIDAVGSFDQAFTDLTKRAEKGTKAENPLEFNSDTVSRDDELPAGLSLSEESQLALAAVDGLTSRIRDLHAHRLAEGRDLSEKAKGHVTDLISSMTDAIVQASLLIEESQPVRATDDDHTEIESLRAQISQIAGIAQ